MEQKIIITGSSKGLGLLLAKNFLANGNKVVISGRNQTLLTQNKILLEKEYPNKIFAFQCDVQNPDSLEELIKNSHTAMGGIDIFINNAGINQETGMVWEVSNKNINDVINTDLLGVMYGSSKIMPYFISQGHGAIWFTEGFGSQEMYSPGLSVYGTSKHALRYYWKALAKEVSFKKLPITINAISPGMMATDFILDKKALVSPSEWEKQKRIFNILGDKPYDVAAFLAPKMLRCKGHGVLISWLTTPKIIGRFLTSGFIKRNIV